jgi:hypothetical protein
MFMSEAARKAAEARWLWRARRARQALSQRLSEHGQRLDGEWCDFAESASLTERCMEIGVSSERVIQAWASKQEFVHAVHSCRSWSAALNEAHCLIEDFPDAGWLKVDAAETWSDLVLAAAEWLTDGFLLYFSPSSLVSVDIEERHDRSVIESTLIGERVSSLRSCLRRLGPPPELIYGPL